MERTGRVFLVLSLIISFLIIGPGDVFSGGILKVGLLQEPKTLNIWLASDTWSKKVLSQIYQPLYIREPDNLTLLPWLAESEPKYNKEELCYEVKLRSAKWSNGDEVTSRDVAFTGELIKRLKVPRIYSKWKFIKRIETPDNKTVRFYLSEPKAIFLTRSLVTPIVHEREWKKSLKESMKAEKPLTYILNTKIEKPVGCGPFILSEWRKGAYIFLKSNPYFFLKEKKIHGRALGPYIKGIIFKIFGTADAAILALQKGTIDMFWWNIQPGYIPDLTKNRKIKLISSEKSALYYLGFNLRKAPFNDKHFRHAVATMIDKDFIVRRILQGHGIRMDSIIPPGNRFWQCPYPPPEYGRGLGTSERIRKAYRILKDAGYGWDIPPVNHKGEIQNARGFKLPDGNIMKRFTILTPPADYDPNRAMSGMMIQEWLRMLGMPAYSKPMAFSSLIEQVKYRHDFDMFILGYGRLSLDPDYIRNFFHSRNDRPRGWNMSGYRNPEFDKLSDLSASEMNVKKRKELICKMQKIIMDDIPYIPLYNPGLIEGVRTDRFSGWVRMLGGVGNIWSFLMVKPK